MGKLAKITDKRAAGKIWLDRRAKMLTLIHKANEKPEHAGELRSFLSENLDLLNRTDILTRTVRESLLELIMTSAGGLEVLKAEIGEMKNRLSSALPTLVESLQLEAAILCWRRVQYAEMYRTQYMVGSHPIREIEFAEKMLTHSHRRLANALRSLARLQSLARPRGGDPEARPPAPLKFSR